MVKIFRIILIGVLFLTGPSKASEKLGFYDLWKIAQKENHQIQLSQSEVQVAEIRLNRSKSHWHPQVYLSNSIFSSDDGGMGLFGKLSQRKVENKDFQLTELNSPGQQHLIRSDLGVRLNLFEGFKWSSLHLATNHALKAKKLQLSLVEKQIYTQLFETYGILWVQKRYILELQKIKGHLNFVLDKYKLGSRSSPLGKSGVLGLRALSDKLEIRQVNAQIMVSRLKQKIYTLIPNLSVHWDLNQEDIEFEGLQRYLKIPTKSDFLKPSLRHQMIAAQQKARIFLAESEKGIYWPKVGAFAQTSQISGERGDATGSSAGLKFTWNLYDPSSVGRSKETHKLQKKARLLEAHSGHREFREKKALWATMGFLSQGVRAADRASLKLSEQVKVSEKLFWSGILKAIQLSQVYNQQIDVSFHVYQLKVQLLKARTNIFRLSHLEMECKRLMNPFC